VTPVQPARSLLVDDFTDPASGWPEEDEEGVPYRVGYHPPDFYHLEPRAAEERLAISLADEYGDVTVETDAFIDHTDTDGGDFRYGLLLRRVAAQREMPITLERAPWPIRSEVGHFGAYRDSVGRVVHSLWRAFDPQGLFVVPLGDGP